jgi:thiol-disulfide isomerase/thioredoxin
MIRMARILIVVAVLVAAIRADTAFARRDRGAQTGLAAIKYAQPAPDFAFDAGAGPRRLASLFGRPVVLNFWASWCEPCQAEVAAFAALRRAYGDAVPLVTVSEDSTPGAAAAYLRAHDVDAISVDDPGRKIFGLYSVVPIPVTLVLAPDGSVRHVSVGELDWPELQAAVDAVRPSDLTLPPPFDTVRSDAGTPEP